MAPTVPDHFLWLGLGIFTFIAAHQVSRGLKHIRTLTHIANPPSSISAPSTPPTHQEDAIKTSSLLTLATSPNTDIRASATRILCARFYASPSAKKALLRDLASKDEDVQHTAQLAFNLLCEMGVWREYEVVAPVAPRAGWRLLGQRERSGLGVMDEREVRRRRREAVVIHEGEGAVGRDDVYMRDEEGRMGSEGARPGTERSRSEELMDELLDEL